MNVKILVLVIPFLIGCAVSSQAQNQTDNKLLKKVEDYLKTITEPTKVLDEASQAYWSPGKTKIAYTYKPGHQEVAGGIFTLLLDGSGKTERITQTGKDPVWSPDGKWIAYVNEGNTQIDETVYLTKADGSGEPQKLADGGYPSWFPDSQHLLYHSRQDRTLNKINIETLKSEVIYDNFGSYYPTLSPDGKRIAFALPQFGLLISNLAGTQAQQLTLENYQGWLGRWSPNGEWIAFGGFVNAQTQLSLVDSALEKGIRVLIPKSFSRPAWSPDRNYIVCDTCEQGKLEVWILNMNTLMFNRI